MLALVADAAAMEWIAQRMGGDDHPLRSQSVDEATRKGETDGP
jgi:hypothetical protein